jgi:hypothetical protein
MKSLFCRRSEAVKVFPRRQPALPPEIPPYGVLIGRMIFTGGLALVILGLGFLIMLGIAAGSLLALLIFGLITLAGLVVCWLAVRDLNGPTREEPALVTDRSAHSEGGNPVYELKFKFTNPPLKDSKVALSYNVNQLDWQRFQVGDRVVVRYSAHFKLLVDIRPNS